MRSPSSRLQPCSLDDLAAALGGPWPVIDVREPAEYHAERIRGSRLTPLSRLDHEIEALPRQGPVYVLCRSGNRARTAALRLTQLGFEDVRVLPGGLMAWAADGRPVERGPSRVWSLERQVRFAAGALVLTAVLAGLLVTAWAALAAGLIGAGLMFSAATDTCALGLVLMRMPWNRRAARGCGCGCNGPAGSGAPGGQAP